MDLVEHRGEIKDVPLDHAVLTSWQRSTKLHLLHHEWNEFSISIGVRGPFSSDAFATDSAERANLMSEPDKC